jgi:hypothetical protein
MLAGIKTVLNKPVDIGLLLSILSAYKRMVTNAG